MKKHRDGSYSTEPRFRVDPGDTIASFLLERARKHPHQVVVEQRTPVGSTRPITAEALQASVDETARGLIAMGVAHGDPVAILSATSYEWMLLDLALLSIGAISVPVYESDSAAQIAHILSDASITRVFTQNSQQAALVESVSSDSVLGIHSFESGALLDVAAAGKGVSARELDIRRRGVRAEDIATIIYTSGTTGLPKGVVLTHQNFVGTAYATRQVLGDIIDSPSTRLLLFLPVAHVLARFVMHLVISGRGVIGFSPDIKNLLPDIAAFKPSVLLVVPRVLEKVYNAALAKAGGGIKGRIFAWSAKRSRAYAVAQESLLGPSPAKKIGRSVADALVLKKIRALLGPNLRYIVSGGAPLSPDLAQFFSGMGLTLLQGYGLSESTGPITVQLPNDRASGYVGPVLPGNAIKIAKDGEILVKGVSVMRGYHGLPEETARVLDRGWFKTGDLGTIDRKHGLRITGRKKELIVTAGGKNVSPEVLEESLATHPLIASVIVVGEARPYIGALIALDHDMAPSWFASHGINPAETGNAAEHPRVLESLERAIARANKKVSRAESIRRFRIIDATFTVENGYMTPSMKLKRSRVLADWAHEVDALYSEGDKQKRSLKKR